jgi:Domain of unknown function (DUF4331)
MSHHLDTPLAAQTGQLFIDDLYVFPGEASTVLIMDVNSDVNGLHSEPGFHPEARYEFKVHFDGAAYEELTYRVSFAAADADGRQALELHTLTGPEAREDGEPGDLVLAGRAVPRCAALRDRHSGGVRLRGPQRADAGRQRPRGHAVPGHRDRRAVGPHARRGQPRAGQRVPLPPPGLTASR